MPEYPQGPYRYYHDSAAREVWAIPEYPHASERLETRTKKRRGGRRLGWSLHAVIEHVRADNFVRPDTNQFHYPMRHLHREAYDARDVLDAVREFFNDRHKTKPGVEITLEGYQRLEKEYTDIALKNPPPSPLPPKLR